MSRSFPRKRESRAEYAVQTCRPGSPLSRGRAGSMSIQFFRIMLLENRQRRQIKTGVLFIDRRECTALRIEEQPGIDPLAQFEIALPHDRPVERGGDG